MARRIRKIIFVYILGLFLLFLIPQLASADDQGKLHLNTDVITNSKTSAGNSGDFPIRGDLFSPELNQKIQKEKTLNEQFPKQAIGESDFKLVNKRSAANYSGIVKTLFTSSYKPGALVSNSEHRQRTNHFWYVLILIGAIILIPLSVGTGWWNSNRKWRKTHAYTH